MTDTLQNFAIAVVQDVCSLAGIPCASTATTIYQEIQARRLGAARDIAIEELRQGHRALSSVSELDEQVAILHRYFRAAHEGAARLNLRLLAKIMAGHSEQAPLYASDFLQYADILGSLRREEILLVGALCRFSDNKRLTDDSHIRTAFQQTVQHLVPSLFPDEEDARSVAEGLTRTGLLTSRLFLRGNVYCITRRMEDLAKLALFDAAVQTEDAAVVAA